MALKQSYETTSSYDNLILNGGYTTNGFFDDVVFSGEGDSFSLSNTFTVSCPFKNGTLQVQTPNVQLYKALRRMYLNNREYPGSLHLNRQLPLGVRLRTEKTKFPLFSGMN